MRVFTVVLICLFTVFGYSQDENIAQLLTNQNGAVSRIVTDREDSPWFGKNISVPIPPGPDNLLDSSSDDETPQLITQEHYQYSASVSRKTSHKKEFETYAVSILYNNGCKVHVADYYDGTKVLTFLDGELKGLQGVGVNGVQTAESNAVEWHSKYFVHYYTNGKIYTYSNKQVLELY